MRSTLRLFALLLALAPCTATAQESDKDYLTRLLEENLSSAGRNVIITGFRGALSSQASLSEMTIADDDGIWLTLRDVTLDWNRAALLRGRVEVTALTAAEIDLPRAPHTATSGLATEARSFSLPVLPVSVSIGQVSAARVTLGPDLFGAAATVSLLGSAQLAGGEGAATVAITRTDGVTGALTLSGSYANASRQLMLDLALTEAPGGIASNLIGLPGEPAIALSVKGAGLIDDFTANIALQTDGQDRLGGTVKLSANAGADPGQPQNRFSADLSGDIAPLFAPDYRDFFGPDIRLQASGLRYPSGRMELSNLDLAADQIALTGSVTLGADGLPEAVDLTGRIADPQGDPLLLPLPGGRTQITSADLALKFSGAAGEGWTGSTRITGLQTANVGVADLTLSGSGRIARQPGTASRVIGANLGFTATGLLPADPALARATGSSLSGRATLYWQDGAPLRLPELSLSGADFAVALNGTLGGLDSGFRFTGKGAAQINDLSRLSDLAARPLSGAVTADASGSYDLLTGGFAATANLTGDDLTVNQPQADRLLDGLSQISVTASRTTEGTRLQSLTIRAATLTAQAQGTLRTGANDLTGRLDFTDLAALGTGFGGALTADARLDGTGAAQNLTLTGTGRNLTIGQPQIDRLLSGTSTLSLTGHTVPAGYFLDQLALNAATLSATASGLIDPGASDIDAALTVTDLAALGPPFGGTLTAAAHLTETGATRSVTLTGTAANVTTGQAQADRLLAGSTAITAAAHRDATGITVDSLSLRNPNLVVRATGTLAGAIRTLAGDLTLPNLGVLGVPYGGSVTTNLRITDDGTRQTLALTGTGQRLTTGTPQADALLSGPSSFALTARRDPTGITLDKLTLNAASLTASAQGRIALGRIALGQFAPEGSDITASATFARLSDLGPGYRGAAQARARLTGTAQSQQVTLNATGTDVGIGQVLADRLLAGQSTLAVVADRTGDAITLRTAALTTAGLTATATGLIRPGASTLQATLRSTSLAALGTGLGGTLTADARYSEAGTARSVSLTGTANGLSIGQPVIDRLLAGTTALDLAATQDQGSLRIDRFTFANPQLSASATGRQTTNGGTVDLSARLTDLGLLAPGFSGPLTVTGGLSDTGGPYQLDLAATGPGAIAARISGTTARSMATANLTIAGSAEAGLLNDILAPRSVQGPVRYDLALNGPVRLSSLSGRIGTTGARLVTEFAGVVLQSVDASATLSGGQAQTALQGAVAGTGGSVSVRGPVSLTAPYSGDLAIALANVGLRDPELYDTTLNGALRMRGPVLGGALISGQVDLGQTEVRVPSTGLGGIAAIPNMTHLRDTADVRATRARAGLTGGAAGSARKGSAAAYPLDVQITAPRRVFIRGRGLDAELGGSIQLAGTTAAIRPEGDLTLIRGRLDILGKRFTLSEGLARLQGQFIPFIRLVASTTADGVTSSIVIEGDATAPAISFTSTPELPEEEVLARLLFGRGLTSISPLQAAQLASAVATLAGTGGEGIVSRLRKGFGLDDLDIQTDDAGNAALRFGKYLSDNVYTDVTVGSDGTSDLSINLDLSPSVTVRGAIGSDGNTGLGLFFEKDY